MGLSKNQEIIKSISKSLGIKIPYRRNSEGFSPERMVEHISYWILLERKEGGKYSKEFMKFFKSLNINDQLEILRKEGIGEYEDEMNLLSQGIPLIEG